jgi:glycosyltransferase involved in cell wall biosynthesis
MLLSRHPYREASGRAMMLRQRIEQARLRFEPDLLVFDRPAGDASDAGMTFLPMANPLSVAMNAGRLGARPLQTWLYFSAATRARIAQRVADRAAAAVYVDMMRLAPLATDLPRNVALIVDYDDLLSERYRLAEARGYDVMGFLAQRSSTLAGIARTFARPILRAEAHRSAVYEQALLSRADLALFTSPREAARMQGAASVLGAAPTIAPRFSATAAIGRRLIFLGNLRYGENVAMLRALAEAAGSLAEEGAWPDDALIEAVGDHAADLAAAFNPKHIRFLGRAPDLAALAAQGVFLAPVVSGTGVKLKVLDGMSLGCPVAATPKACEGLSVRANRDLIVAATPRDVLSTALKLRDRPALKAMLAKRGIAYLERAHSSAISTQVSDAFEAAVARARQETL